MKQGLAEVVMPELAVGGSAAAAAVHADAMLVDRAVVEDLNEVIRRHGAGKVDTLVAIKVRRCRLKAVQRRAESAWSQRLTLICDELVSSFAFNFNLRRYIKDFKKGIYDLQWENTKLEMDTDDLAGGLFRTTSQLTSDKR